MAQNIQHHSAICSLPVQVDILGTGVHGSGLITQGEAQCLVTATVGRDLEERRTEGILGKGSDRIIVHYNSPIAAVTQVCIIAHALAGNIEVSGQRAWASG